jgi:DUF971 family protein
MMHNYQTSVELVSRARPSKVPTSPGESQPAKITVSLAELSLLGNYAVRDLWAQKDLGIVTEKISSTVNSHGAVLYRIKPVK